MRQKEMAAPSPHPPPPPLRLRHQFNRRRDRRRGPQPRRPGGPVCAGHRSGAAASAWPLRQCLASVPRVISTTHHRRASGARGAATGRARRGGAGGGKSSSCRGGGRELRGQRVGGGLGSNKCNHGRAPQGSLISRARDARARFKGAFNRARSWAPSPHITGANRFVHILGRARPGPPAASRGRGRG